MRTAALAAAVFVLGGWAAAGAGAAVPERTSVPSLVHGPALAAAPSLRSRDELRARRASRLATLHVLQKRASRLAWGHAFDAAATYARRRSGRVSFSFVDDTGRVRSYHGRRTYYSASLVKAMLLVSYLRQRAVRHKQVPSSARSVLAPMIRRSDNNAASRIFRIVGTAGLERLARAAGMRWFATDPAWGDTHLAAEDQSTFFYGIDLFVPPLHRAYARLLLSHVIPEQRWGIPRAVHGHKVHVYFKGGWRPSGGGWIVNQSALLMARDGRRMSISVLTDHDPGFAYGQETLRGVAQRLVRVFEAE